MSRASVNCTGPDTNLARVRDPLVQSLRAAGLIRPDELGLGLDTDESGGLVGADGSVGDDLLCVGPLRKGRLWENTAVPELRGETLAMARRLTEQVVVRRGATLACAAELFADEVGSSGTKVAYRARRRLLRLWGLLRRRRWRLCGWWRLRAATGLFLALTRGFHLAFYYLARLRDLGFGGFE